MEYLDRDGAPISEELWGRVDCAVTDTMKRALVGRKFIPFYGPLGSGVQFAKIDSFDKEEEFDDGIVKTSGRKIVEVPQLYADFWLNWRDVEAANGDDDVDLAPAMLAARKLANIEDDMIFYGIPKLGIDGILTVKGSQSVKRGDWNTGENAFKDVNNAITALEKAERLGRYTLVLSPDMYASLMRIQPGTGEIELERIKKLLAGGKIVKSTVLKDKTAVLVCSEAYYIDLLVGQDVNTGHVDDSDYNYCYRVNETALIRIKAPDAIVVIK